MLDSVDSGLRRLRNVNRRTLQGRPKGASVRIVALSYDEVWGIDRAVLDDISYVLDLDPAVLWRLFDHDLSHLKDPTEGLSKLDRGGTITQQLPSERSSLAIKDQLLWRGTIISADSKRPRLQFYIWYVVHLWT